MKQIEMLLAIIVLSATLFSCVLSHNHFEFRYPNYNNYNPYENLNNLSPYENWQNNLLHLRNLNNNFGNGFGERIILPNIQNYQNFGRFRDVSDDVETISQSGSFPNSARVPLDVDFVSGTIGNPGETEVGVNNHHHIPTAPRPPPGFDILHPHIGGGNLGGPDDVSSIFHHTFGNVLGPNFGSNGFGTIDFGQNGFGPGFEGLFPVTYVSPWWKGPNICTERKEDIEDMTTQKPDELLGDVSFFGSGTNFNLNFESCVEKQQKHICKTVTNNQGRVRTVTVTKQCCHGYARVNNGAVNSECEKFEMKSVPETGIKLGAKEFIKSAKNNGLEERLMANLTIFAPIDSAFTDFTENMFESNLVVLPLRRTRRQTQAKTYTNKDLILNHIVDDWINMEDIENEQIFTTAYENSTIRINIFPRPPNDDSFQYPYRFTANCAPLIKVNEFSSNGIVHTIERVLTPVTKTILQLLKERRDMTVFRSVLEKTNLEKMFDDNDKTFTLFAPTDRAFEKLDPQLKRFLKEGNGCALNIVKNHILDLTFCSSAVIAEAKTNTLNILGQRLNFEKSDNKNDEAEGNEIADLIGLKDIIINGDARITETDLMATNGVLHIIDSIIPTESGLPITSVLEKRNLTIFKQLVTAANVEDQFDALTNVTFLVPTDKAFEDNEWKVQLNENPTSLKNNKELQKFLKYHIIEPLVKTCDLTETNMNTVSGEKLRINLYTTHPIFKNIMNRATANCGRIIHFDDESCGSVLHQVDKVLTPPKNNILQELESHEHYSMFLSAIRESNLTSLLEDMEQDFTIFVPKNDVFREVREWYTDTKQNKQAIMNMIKTHIVPDVLCCAGIIHSEWPFRRTIETINNVHLLLNRDRRPKIENAGITKCDIITKNGVIHEINEVIYN